MKIPRPRLYRRDTPRTVVTLYTRAGCHLCDDAKRPVARAVAATPGATLRIVDIDTDEDLEALYGLRIPIVTASSRGEAHVVAEGKVSDLRLRRALSALPGRA